MRKARRGPLFWGVDLSGKKILFVVNYGKRDAGALSERLDAAARGAGAETEVKSGHALPPDAFAGADFCCVIGGDGTILACVEGAVKHGVPIFGINLGKLGFMATFTDGISDAEFLEILGGGGRIKPRSLLEARWGGERRIALNEFAVKSPGASGILSLAVRANGEFVANFEGDGIILSTPTGSSAYNLSAGGPLIYPRAKAFALTSICPHTLSNRSIVFGADMEIEVLRRGGDAVLIADGAPCPDWSPEEPLFIRVPEEAVKFLKPEGHSHFSILRTKLGWSENPRKGAR